MVSGSDGFAASYDFNGNLIQHRAGGLTRSLSYDLENQLTQVTPSGGIPLASQFTYDYAGDRVKQAVGSTTILYPDNLYEVETTSAGTSTSKQIVLGNFRVATRKTGARAGTYFHHTDHLGSTAVVTDAAGCCCPWTWDYCNRPRRRSGDCSRYANSPAGYRPAAWYFV